MFSLGFSVNDLTSMHPNDLLEKVIKSVDGLPMSMDGSDPFKEVKSSFKFCRNEGAAFDEAAFEAARPRAADRCQRSACPLLWGLRPMPACDRLAATKMLTPWDTTVHKAHLAVSLLLEDARGDREFKNAKGLLVDCFLPLLDVFASLRCPLVARYRQALRRVLDASWRLLAAAAAGRAPERGCPRWHRAMEAARVDALDEDTMDTPQMAALYALRARMSNLADAVHFAKAAVDLEPGQGEWHYTLANALEATRYARGQHVTNVIPMTGEERQAWESARALSCSNKPKVCLEMAWALFEQGGDDRARSKVLVREAIDHSPDSPGVLKFAIGVCNMMAMNGGVADMRIVKECVNRLQAVDADHDAGFYAHMMEFMGQVGMPHIMEFLGQAGMTHVPQKSKKKKCKKEH